MRQLLTILIALLILVSIPSFALPSDHTKPYHISAKKIVFEQDKHLATYTGNVIIIQGSTQLTGDKVILNLDKSNSQIEKLVDYGKPAHYHTLPNEGKKILYAQAKKITYFPQKQEALLEGKGQVIQDKNVFRGPHIWYDIQSETVISTTPQGKGKTTLLIQPQDVQ